MKNVTIRQRIFHDDTSTVTTPGAPLVAWRAKGCATCKPIVVSAREATTGEARLLAANATRQVPPPSTP